MAAVLREGLFVFDGVPRVVCAGFGLGLFGLKEAMDLAVRIGFTGGGVSRFIVGRHDCFESD